MSGSIPTVIYVHTKENLLFGTIVKFGTSGISLPAYKSVNNMLYAITINKKVRIQTSKHQCSNTNPQKLQSCLDEYLTKELKCR